MGTLILARHGESEFGGPEERYCGWSDVGLTEVGRNQAECLARRLRAFPIAAIFSSDLSRAAETAEAIARLHRLDAQRLREFREQNYGEWEGLTTPAIKARCGDLYSAREARPGQVAPPGGESYQQVLLRVRPSFDELLRRAQTETLVVVAHRGVNRAILSHLLDAPLDHARRIHQSPVCVNLIEVSALRVQVTAINDTFHLNVEMREVQ